jgi:hypothetical protein
MKFNIKYKISLMEFIPRVMVPRNGPLKQLEIEEGENHLKLSSKRCKSITLPKNLTLESMDFIAIGLYLAEGSKYVNPNNKTKHSGEIDFANCSSISVSIMMDLLSKLGIKSSDLSWKIGLNINYRDTISDDGLFGYWIKELNIIKEKSRPKWFYYSGSIGGRLSNNTGKMG